MGVGWNVCSSSEDYVTQYAQEVGSNQMVVSCVHFTLPAFSRCGNLVQFLVLFALLPGTVQYIVLCWYYHSIVSEKLCGFLYCTSYVKWLAETYHNSEIFVLDILVINFSC